MSNYSASQMRHAAERLARYQIPLAAAQVHYSLAHRQPEVNGVLEACRELQVALVAYRPLEGGLFRSITAPGVAAAPSSSTRTNRKTPAPLEETLQAVARQHGTSVSQVVLNWLLKKDAHIIPIPGTTSAHHAQENAEALTWMLSDEEFASIDEVSAPGKPELRSHERRHV